MYYSYRENGGVGQASICTVLNIKLRPLLYLRSAGSSGRRCCIVRPPVTQSSTLGNDEYNGKMGRLWKLAEQLSTLEEC